MKTAAVYGKALYADLYRAFLSKRFAFSVLLVIGALLAASFEGIALNTEVLYVFSLVMYGMPAMLVMIGGASAYADSIFSDIEHRYIRGILVRTGVKQYVFSKMNSIFLAGMLNVGLGIFLYALFLRLKLPWVQAESGQYQHLLLSGGLRFFLDRAWFTAYFLLWGLQYGALSGILAVLSAGLSLFTRNRLLVLATPFLGYYFIDLFLSELSQNRYSLALIFAPSNNVLGSGLLAFFVVFPISAAVLLCVGLVTERKVRKEFLNE